MADETRTATLDEAPRSSPLLAGERIAFTGTLASMTHDEARILVSIHGGESTDHASRRTTMLVVGEEGWPLDRDGEPSLDFANVTTWIAEGLPIELVRESDWLHLLGLREHRDEVHRLYTPAMLCELLGVEVGDVRRWERQGLIRAVKRVHRLPYFDFQEVTSARRLSELLASGASRERIERSLRILKERFPDLDRPLAQLDLLAEDSRLLYRDGRGLVDPRSRQRHFDFAETPGPDGGPDGDDETEDEADDEPATLALHRGGPGASATLDWTAGDWFQQGCELADVGELDEAVEAFRAALMQVPDEPEFHLHLAEVLYRKGCVEAALERYYVAVERDNDYVEAWTQIGCLHEERDQLEAALDAYRIALEVHPEYPDAHLFLADALHRLGRTEEAISHWRVYLRYDTRGPWADRARAQLQKTGAGAAAPNDEELR